MYVTQHIPRIVIKNKKLMGYFEGKKLLRIKMFKFEWLNKFAKEFEIL